MAEPTLTMTRLELKKALGEKLAIARDPNDWSADAAADVDRILAKGLRSFYSPLIRTKNPNAPLESHQWSFLIRRTTVSLSNGTNLYTLTDDFGGFLDTELMFVASNLSSGSAKTWPLKIVEWWRVLEKIDAGTSMPTGISQPLLAAIEPVTFTPATGQRWQMAVWPTPTSSLSVSGRYRSQPDFFSDDTHYPLGGSLHAETLLESCLAAAEEFQNDSATLHRERFQQLLEASIAADKELHAVA